MAPYKKTLKGSKYPLCSSTKAGFCLFPPSKKHGRLKERRLSLKLPDDGRRYLRSRRSAYRPKEDGWRFISASTPCRTSDILRLWDSLGICPSISREDLFCSGIPALSIERGLSKNSLRVSRVFTRISSPDTLLSLIPMSSSGDTLNALQPMAFQKIFTILETPLIALPGNLKNPGGSCCPAYELRN